MTQVHVYGRLMTVQGVWPGDFTHPIYSYEPIPDDDAGSFVELEQGTGKGVIRGRSFSALVEVPGDKGVVELAPGLLYLDVGGGEELRYVRAEDVVGRALRNMEGYRLIKVEPPEGGWPA